MTRFGKNLLVVFGIVLLVLVAISLGGVTVTTPFATVFSDFFAGMGTIVGAGILALGTVTVLGAVIIDIANLFEN